MAYRTNAGLLSGVGALCAAVLLVCPAASAQRLVPLDRVSDRRASDFAPALEGQTVAVQGVVSSAAIPFPSYSQLAIQSDDGHGLVLEGAPPQFSNLQPGDRVEAHGTVSKRGGLPVVQIVSVRAISHGPAPAPKSVEISALQSFDNLGALVTVEGRVAAKGESDGGEYLLLGGRNNPLKVFLPLSSPRTAHAHLARFDPGDKVRVTGVAAQASLYPPYNGSFEVLLPGDDSVALLSKPWLLSPELFGMALFAIAFALVVWWLRERRMAVQRNLVRTFYNLGEEMIGAGPAAIVVKKLNAVVPAALGISGVNLYVYNRSTRALDMSAAVPDAEPFAVPVYAEEGSLPLGAAVCFRNRALLTIPDTWRSPFFPDGRAGLQPRSLMFVPMFAESEVVGVLELYENQPMHEFGPDGKVLGQHLGNQIGLALRLSDEKSIREQLYRSEKLAAVGQLMSGIAAELKGPLETISNLAESAIAAPSLAWDDLTAISGEARKASDLVSRLVSFMQPERVEAKRIDLNSLLLSLIEFRRQEWESRGFEVRDMLCPNPVYVLGSQGQLERVFLDLLIQAEQSMADAAGKVLIIGTSVLAQRVLVDISYSVDSSNNSLPDGAEAIGAESLSRGIVRSHGGEMRFMQTPQGECRLEVEIPVAPTRLAAEGETGARPFTCLVVEPDDESREALVRMLTGRGCRVIPAAGAGQSMELVQRLRFDIVFCSIGLPGLNWIEFSEDVRSRIGAFVLLTEAFDFDLSRGMLSGESNVLTRPFSDDDLDRLLGVIETKLSTPEGGRRLQIIRHEKRAISL